MNDVTLNDGDATFVGSFNKICFGEESCNQYTFGFRPPRGERFVVMLLGSVPKDCKDFDCEAALNRLGFVREEQLTQRLHETLEKHRTTLSQLEQKERECEELRKDAERYRWLREGAVLTACVEVGGEVVVRDHKAKMSGFPSALDDAIDAAMAKEGAQ